jgi:hypothetical protein
MHSTVLRTYSIGNRCDGRTGKRRDGIHHATRCDWVKVKTPEWKEAHKDRGELFGEDRHSPDPMRE